MTILLWSNFDHSMLPSIGNSFVRFFIIIYIYRKSDGIQLLYKAYTHQRRQIRKRVAKAIANHIEKANIELSKPYESNTERATLDDALDYLDHKEVELERQLEKTEKRIIELRGKLERCVMTESNKSDIVFQKV